MTFAQTVVRKLMSRAVNFTPNVIYYPREWRVKVGDKLLRRAATNAPAGSSTMTVAAIAMCCAMKELPEGKTATIELGGVTSHGEDIGDFVVTVRRALAEKGGAEGT